MIWIPGATCCCSPCCPARQAGQPLILPSPGNKWLTTNALLAGIVMAGPECRRDSFSGMIPYAFKHDVIDGRRHLGLGFVAQRLGMDHMGPFTFNGLRFLLGALSCCRSCGGSSHASRPSLPVITACC